MRSRLKWPTSCLVLVILGGFVLWSVNFNRLPLWLAAPMGSLLLTWYGSLQHETIYGHPTASRHVNRAIGGLPLTLWVPYTIYRETHIQHHRHSGRRLTELDHDPESFYLPPGHLAKVGRFRRAALRANCTLLGRILIGPLIAMTTFWSQELDKARIDRRRHRIWLWHAVGVVAVLSWTSGICHISLLDYLLFVIYPSVALTHLRSFAEHRADDHSQLRTNVVEAHPFWALLFLNNNLHVAHHTHPHAPWYELPRIWREQRAARTAVGRIFNGYSEVARDYLLQPFITAEHPFARLEVE